MKSGIGILTGSRFFVIKEIEHSPTAVHRAAESQFVAVVIQRIRTPVIASQIEKGIVPGTSPGDDGISTLWPLGIFSWIQ